MSENKTTVQRIEMCFKNTTKPALKSMRWLLSLMIPISFGVMLMDYSGLLIILAKFTVPFVKLFGLRGEAALVLLSGGFLNIYSAIAVIDTIHFTSREICIMAFMCLTAHNLIIETAVQKKTGSNPIQMVLLRISVAFIGGFILHTILPGGKQITNTINFNHTVQSINVVFINWLISTAKLIIKIIIIVYLLNLLQKLMDEFSISRYLSTFMSPVLRFFGLPVQAAFMWIIANVIGLAWGSSVLIEQSEQGKITKDEADILNHHIAISHSLLEDTLLFVAIGVSAFWITIPRLIMAFLVVWVYRLIKRKSLN